MNEIFGHFIIRCTDAFILEHLKASVNKWRSYLERERNKKKLSAKMCVNVDHFILNEAKTNLNVHFWFLLGVCFLHRFLSKTTGIIKRLWFSPLPFSCRFLSVSCSFLQFSKLNVLRPYFKVHNAVCVRLCVCVSSLNVVQFLFFSSTNKNLSFNFNSRLRKSFRPCAHRGPHTMTQKVVYLNENDAKQKTKP